MDSVMSGPSAWLTLPQRWMFKIPPEPFPTTLPPPSDAFTLKSPVNINPALYDGALAAYIPFAFAASYVALVASFNLYNRRRGYKPFWISKTRLFFVFVLFHNVFLALFSAMTFVAMVRAVYVSWPGLFDEHGLAGAVDALCKIHGPRGFGDAVTYNTTTLEWKPQNRQIHLAENGLTPDDTDVGRIWNEGLAFWGWLFYLSKFYEVVDTVIILAKGKRSSTLQTYHHSGAMLSMWAGIRYMSPPIWLFVLFNSGVHAVMYSYYTLTTLGVRVPLAVKRSITTMQITQFVVGSSYAALYLFVAYSVPVSVRYDIVETVSALPSDIADAAKSISSTASELMSTASLSSLAAQATQPHAVAWLKKLAFRAAGTEGLAETVRDGETGEVFGPEYADHSETLERMRHEAEEARWHSDPRDVSCIDTSGATFAILLNLFYLAPLTLLFLRFFWKTYVSGPPAGRRGESVEQKRRRLGEGLEDAARRTEAATEDAGKAVEDGMEKVGQGVKDGVDQLNVDIDAVLDRAQSSIEKGKRSMNVDGVIERIRHEVTQGSRELQDAWHSLDVDQMLARLKKDVQQGKIKAEEILERVRREARQAADKLAGEVEEGEENLKKGLEHGRENLQKGAEKVSNAVEQGRETAQGAVEQGKDAARKGVAKAAEGVEHGAEAVEARAHQVKESARAGSAQSKKSSAPAPASSTAPANRAGGNAAAAAGQHSKAGHGGAQGSTSDRHAGEHTGLVDEEVAEAGEFMDEVEDEYGVDHATGLEKSKSKQGGNGNGKGNGGPKRKDGDGGVDGPDPLKKPDHLP